MQLGKEFFKLSNERGVGRVEKTVFFSSLNQLFLMIFGLRLIIFTVLKEKQLILRSPLTKRYPKNDQVIDKADNPHKRAVVSRSVVSANQR